MRNVLVGYFYAYKGIKGTIEYDYDSGSYTGKLAENMGRYYGKTVEELHDNFISIIDELDGK